MPRNREIVAWFVVWISFATFLLSCAAVIVGGRWYLMNATDPTQATLKVVVGTVVVQENGGPRTIAVPEMPLREGSIIRTERSSQALITLFDDTTITLLPETELTFSSLRLSRFAFIAPLRGYTKVTQAQGKTVVGVAPSSESPSRFEVDVPQGLLKLSEGSYTIDVSNSLARVRVKDAGKATVTSLAKTVEAGRGQRIDVFSGQPPRAPEPSAVELIAGGDFKDGLNGWRMDNLPGFSEGTDILGAVQAPLGGTPSIRFTRIGSKGTHNETYIAQDIDEDVSSLTSLQFTIEFKLVKQSLSGGGYVGSEYPLLVRIHYQSDRGETYIFKGFYYQNDAKNRTDNGLPFPQDSWITYHMPENLMTLSPIPRKITRIEIGASGHDYVSEVRNVSLSGE